MPMREMFMSRWATKVIRNIDSKVIILIALFLFVRKASLREDLRDRRLSFQQTIDACRLVQRTGHCTVLRH